jgi:hypothetical protein
VHHSTQAPKFRSAVLTPSICDLDRLSIILGVKFK